MQTSSRCARPKHALLAPSLEYTMESKSTGHPSTQQWRVIRSGNLNPTSSAKTTTRPYHAKVGSVWGNISSAKCEKAQYLVSQVHCKRLALNPGLSLLQEVVSAKTDSEILCSLHQVAKLPNFFNIPCHRILFALV